MPDAQWYESMAAAMKKRERCLNGIVRWQAELAEAEAEIQALRDGDVASADDDKFNDVSFPPEFKAAAPQLVTE